MQTDRSAIVVVVIVLAGLAGLAVLGAIVVLAMGKGGELAKTHPDYPPLPLAEGRSISPEEAAMLRLPRSLIWGYQPDLTDEALQRLTDALSERDVRMAALEEQLKDLRNRLNEPGPDEPTGLDEWRMDEPRMDERDADPLPYQAAAAGELPPLPDEPDSDDVGNTDTVESPVDVGAHHENGTGQENRVRLEKGASPDPDASPEDEPAGNSGEQRA